jgi:hypothetical protein
MPCEQFALGCWFLAMFGMGFVFGMLAVWWIAVEVRADRQPSRKVSE